MLGGRSVLAHVVEPPACPVEQLVGEPAIVQGDTMGIVGEHVDVSPVRDTGSRTTEALAETVDETVTTVGVLVEVGGEDEDRLI